MIKSIELKYFQTHKNTKIDFSSGVNVIKGQSRNGKSCIIRAMKWVLENRPTTESLISHFAPDKSKTGVRLDLDGVKVARLKDGKFNGYTIDDKELKAIRSDVPEEVSKLLDMNDLNLQSQFDKFFLLQDSGGEVARQLNEFVGLSIIDASIKKTNSLISSTKSDMEYKTSDLEKKKELATSYQQTFPLLDSQLSILENMVSMYTDLKETKERLSRQVYSIRAIKDKIWEYTIKIKAESDLCAILESVDDFVKQEALATMFRSTLDSIKSIESSIKSMDGNIEKVEKEYHALLLSAKVCPLCGKEI